MRQHHELGELNQRLRGASEVDGALMNEIIGAACRRFPSLGQRDKTARIELLIRSSAWTDAALALIDLEPPQKSHLSPRISGRCGNFVASCSGKIISL